jgi:hypothetical protein
LYRTSGLGFCPKLGSVLGVSIDRRSDGTYLLQSSVAVERPLGDPACVVYFESSAGKCIAADPLPGRVLTNAELDRVRSGFAAIDVHVALLPACAITEFDPCVVTELEWDGVRFHDDDVCQSPWVGPEELRALDVVLGDVIEGVTP